MIDAAAAVVVSDTGRQEVDPGDEVLLVIDMHVLQMSTKASCCQLKKQCE